MNTQQVKYVQIRDKIERRPIASLVPYASNSRTHSDEQIEQLAASMRECGWTNPVLVDEAGGIIAGHGRVLAAQRLQMAEVPVIVASGWTAAQKRAYVIADNKLALNAGWDGEVLTAELDALNSLGFDLDLVGFSEDELIDLLAAGDTSHDDVPSEGAGASKLNPDVHYQVVVTCQSEAAQATLIHRLENEGMTCRALMF